MLLKFQYHFKFSVVCNILLYEYLFLIESTVTWSDYLYIYFYYPICLVCVPVTCSLGIYLYLCTITSFTVYYITPLSKFKTEQNEYE